MKQVLKWLSYNWKKNQQQQRKCHSLGEGVRNLRLSSWKLRENVMGAPYLLTAAIWNKKEEKRNLQKPSKNY